MSTMVSSRRRKKYQVKDPLKLCFSVVLVLWWAVIPAVVGITLGGHPIELTLSALGLGLCSIMGGRAVAIQLVDPKMTGYPLAKNATPDILYSLGKPEQPSEVVYNIPGLLSPEESRIASYTFNWLTKGQSQEYSDGLVIGIADCGREGYSPEKIARTIIEDYKTYSNRPTVKLVTWGSGYQVIKELSGLFLSYDNDLVIKIIAVDPYTRIEGVTLLYRVLLNIVSPMLYFWRPVLGKYWETPVFIWDGHERSIGEMTDILATIAYGNYACKAENMIVSCIADKEIFYYDVDSRDQMTADYIKGLYNCILFNNSGKLCHFEDAKTSTGYNKALARIRLRKHF